MDTHVVWVPMLGATESDVPPATRVVGQLAARHYWDAEGALMAGYRERLGLGGPAWDVYLLYARDAVWSEASPPQPRLWMHQLGPEAPGPALDAERFAAGARRAHAPDA